MCQAHGPTCQTLRAAATVARNASWKVTVLVPWLDGLDECALAAADAAGVAFFTELVDGYVRAQFSRERIGLRERPLLTDQSTRVYAR